MAERELATSEAINLHERGGLTQTHWREVIGHAGKYHDEKVRKIVAYGQHVISGRFPDSGFHHRQYLGSRHWRGLPTGFLTYYYGNRFIVNRLAIETSDYAFYESEAIYTLNDYINDLKTPIYDVDERKTRYPGLLLDENAILRTWLLAKGDISDVDKNQVEKLQETLISLAQRAPGAVQKRLEEHCYYPDRLRFPERHLINPTQVQIFRNDRTEK